MPKYIFVTGGVVSSVGKGIVTAAIGRILKSRGLSVTVQKLDPYLNVDPGTMSPYQHGEVFVTADGTETDLDLGHYERFLDVSLTRSSSVSTGQIYQSVLGKERRGDYLGGTIQPIPHVTNEIKGCIRAVGRESGADVVLIEVGGTVGDIEGQPFLEAIRQMRKEEGRHDTLSVHVTLLPYLGASGELKTKPTQHSVRELRSMGVLPDVIICRSDRPVKSELKAKISLFCDVESRGVISLLTMPSIYEVPLVLEEEGLGDYILELLRVSDTERDLDDWRELVARLQHPTDEVTVAVVGKYVELHDAYLSVKEALIHAGVHYNTAVQIRWVQSELLEQGDLSSLDGVQGIIVPGGFGERGVEGKIQAARLARTQKIPYLGLCLGLQVMVIEAARAALQSEEPNSTEFAPETPHPVISLLSEQEGVTQKGATMRLGCYPCRLVPGTRAHEAYGVDDIEERHRHRYEFNNAYRDVLAKAGLIASGLSPDGQLVEVCEMQDHPFMVGSQFHPEFQSRPLRPHPLFREFIGAVAAYAGQGESEGSEETAKIVSDVTSAAASGS
ncbi:MAG: CTP synthase [Chloroflexi bacterium]|nr:CTP synthase [Chloroflexota bacterium]